MRTILVHLRGTNASDVGAFLRTLCPRQPGPPWIWESQGETEGGAVLIINYCRDSATPEKREALRAALGSAPDVSISADVSGGYRGDAEVQAFVRAMLERFGGVATDDYTAHAWTLSELQADALIEGHPFFDHEGWYETLRPKDLPLRKPGGPKGG